MDKKDIGNQQIKCYCEIVLQSAGSIGVGMDAIWDKIEIGHQTYNNEISEMRFACM